MVNRCLASILVLAFYLSSHAFFPSAFADTGDEDASHKPAIPEKKEIQEMEKLRGDFMQWFDVQKEKRSHQFQSVLEIKLFQTNVFFGSVAAFFAVLVVLFALKLIYNIVRDSLTAVYEKILQMMGRDTATVREHYFAPVMKDSSGKVIVGLGAGKTNGIRPVQTKKRFLFCDVMAQFVNPLITPETIQKALTDQNAREPKPRIGSVLIEYRAVSQEDVNKTLKLQQQFRAQK